MASERHFNYHRRPKPLKRFPSLCPSNEGKENIGRKGARKDKVRYGTDEVRGGGSKN